MKLHPSVQLIIPVYHPGEELEQLLRKMAVQTRPVDSIHLLITGNKTEYEQLCRQYVTLFDDQGQGAVSIQTTRIEPECFDHGGTRHMGASASEADVLLFMTQDAIPADAYLVEQLVGALYAKESIAAAYARQLPTSDCNPIERYTRKFNYPDHSRVKTAADLPQLGIKTYFCSNVCAAYKREIYEKMGGFVRRTIFNEDMIYAAGLIGAGYSVAYGADARVIHSHNYSGLQQLHRNFDLAVSQAEHPEIFEGVPSEGEGIRMVKSIVGYLCKTCRAYLIPKLFWQSGWKYVGYFLGKRYRRLPKWLILKLTMNRRYWD